MKVKLYVQVVKSTMNGKTTIRVTDYELTSDSIYTVVQVDQMVVDVRDFTTIEMLKLINQVKKVDLLKRKADMEASLAEINTQIEGVK